MREIYYNSDLTPDAANEIKLLALYYDKIHVVNDAVYAPKFETVNNKLEFAGVEDLQFIPKSLKSDYKILFDENILAITNKDENKESEFDKKLQTKISQLVNSSYDLIFPLHPTEKDVRIVTEEVMGIMKYMLDLEWGKGIERDFIWWYYAFKLKWFLKLLMEGKNCLSSSHNLNCLFTAFINDYDKQAEVLDGKGNNKSLAFDALKIALPNPDLLSFEDVLELRRTLRDELTVFRQTVNSIEVRNKELLNAGLQNNQYESMFFTELQRPLLELENKMKNLHSKTFRKFVDRMQNPKSYAPLIGTVVANLPLQYMLLASLGLSAGMSYLEYKEEKREITSNGLYYLLKLKS